MGRRRRRVGPTDEWGQIELLCGWPEQRDYYEPIRPSVLFGGPASERAAEKGGILVLDEPTNGLHLAGVERLLGLLDRLVDSGKSVVVERHQAVMARADWIVDLGPGAGHDGGRIVFEGTPASLVGARSILTGEHLAAYDVGT